jgi:hypothetical protein
MLTQGTAWCVAIVQPTVGGDIVLSKYGSKTKRKRMHSEHMKVHEQRVVYAGPANENVLQSYIFKYELARNNGENKVDETLLIEMNDTISKAKRVPYHWQWGKGGINISGRQRQQWHPGERVQHIEHSLDQPQSVNRLSTNLDSSKFQFLFEKLKAEKNPRLYHRDPRPQRS